MNYFCCEGKFLRDVSNHQMTIIRDDGVERHIRFKKPESGNMRFDLITWSGHLCYTGDMGTYVFQRMEDMFQFFRTDRKQLEDQGLYINDNYWAEKCIAVDKPNELKKYSPDLFRANIETWRDEVLSEREGSEDFKAIKNAFIEAVNADILSYADDGEQDARKAANDFEFLWNDDKTDKIYISDLWDYDLQEYTFRFIWCCYAVAWGIQQYDKAKDN